MADRTCLNGPVYVVDIASFAILGVPPKRTIDDTLPARQALQAEPVLFRIKGVPDRIDPVVGVSHLLEGLVIVVGSTQKDHGLEGDARGFDHPGAFLEFIGHVLLRALSVGAVQVGRHHSHFDAPTLPGGAPRSGAGRWPPATRAAMVTSSSSPTGERPIPQTGQPCTWLRSDYYKDAPLRAETVRLDVSATTARLPEWRG